MATFQVIDTADGGDTRYEGFVKDAANWAILEAGWTTPAFSAGDFTAGGAQTWTVAAGDVTTFAYQIIGKTMRIMFNIKTTTVGGTPNEVLNIAIPASKTAAKEVTFPIVTLDNNTRGIGFASISAGGAIIQCAKSDYSVWAASTNLTGVYGSVTFEIS